MILQKKVNRYELWTVLTRVIYITKISNSIRKKGCF
jgi:hypothetical protein